VLIGAQTGSAGEAVALALRTRPHTRFFGTATAGLSTGNEVVTLGGGWRMAVTAGIAIDALGRLHRGAIHPDVDTGEDDPAPAVNEWLGGD